MSFHLIKPDTKIDFIRLRYFAFALSGLMILIGAISLFTKGGPRYGIDFAGGVIMQTKFDAETKIDAVKKTLEATNLPGLVVQQLGKAKDNEFLIRTSIGDNVTSAAVQKTVSDAFTKDMAFRDLTRFDFKLWGTDWDGDAILAPYVQLAGARISPDDCVRIYNAAKININLHSSTQARELVTGGDFVNPRTFEVAACGGFQLVDRRSLMAELFAEDELAVFDSMEELLPRIEHYLAHPEEREAVAMRGRARVLKDHTYAQRMQTLLEFIARKRPGWPKARAAAPAVEGMPAELAEQIAALLERLGLPSSAAFEDVVWALRQKQGRLDGLDAAVLFLDEWRKLYAKSGGGKP